MKSIILVGVLTIGVSVQAADSAAKKELAHKPTENPLSSEFSVVARDAHSTVWERVEYQATPDGQKVAITNQYTELANGLNFTNSTGEYVESKELIEILPEGGAAALHGQFRAWFPADISEGVIEVLTPDGMNLKSRPAGISYFNGKESVLIAELKSSIGQLLPSGNQVIWTNCFTDVAADLVVTYRKGGIECDLVFRENPPGPEQWNLGPDTRLQLLTEFFDTQEPVKEIGEAHPQSGLRDTTLRFGSVMTMTVGKAFSVGDAAVDEGTAVEPDETQVYKSWEILSDPQDPKVQRTFLIEEVPYERVEQKLKDLPTRTAKSSSPPLEGSGVGSALHRVTPGRVLPPQRLAKQGGKKMELAQANVSSKAGYVLDWVINLSSGTTYALRGDTTFYLSAPVTFSGVVIFEPGSVLKYASGASLAVGGVNWQASEYRPVVFTSKNDNSVGETVSGSSGNPSGDYYANPALQLPYGSAALSHFRIAHAQQAVQFSSAGVTLAHGQIVNCQNGVTPANASLSLKNVLFANVITSLSGLQYSSVSAENVTFAGSVNHPMTFSALASGPGPHGISLKNCILARMTLFWSGPPPLNISGSHNGFYNTPAAPAALTSSFSPTGNPFQSAGAGNYYLTDAGFRDVGTPEINAGLLADLKKRTTYPPQDRANLTISASETWPVQAQRDNDGLIDLGFHYSALDYLVKAVTINPVVTLTLDSGVAVASYGAQGFNLQGGSRLLTVGTPVTRNQFCVYQAVQEQPLALVTSPNSMTLTYSAAGYPAAKLEAQFTDFNGMGGTYITDGWNFWLKMRDCYAGPGKLNCYTPSGAPTTIVKTVNNVFERVTLLYDSFDYFCPLDFYNNLLRNSSVSFQNDWGSIFNWTARDNVFENSTVNVYGGDYFVHDHNAYRNTTTPSGSGGNDVPLTSLTYATGSLGDRYIDVASTTPTLVNAGSRTAATAGLYHHTVKTSNVKEGAESPTTVDIGFHYVATANNVPIDTDGDGVPDYWEDTNGNGTYEPGIDVSDWLNGAIQVVTIAATDATASEIGPDPGMYRITRTGGDQSMSLTVNYVRDASSTASTSDYQTLLGFALIPANVGFVDVPLTPVLDANSAEGNETLVLAVSASPNYSLGTPATATVTIKDASVVTIAATDATASEIGPDPGMYRITRTGGDQSTSLTVNYVRDASSTASTSDYQTLLGFALIPANVGFVDVPLTPVLDANSAEGNETLVLAVSANPNYSLGTPATATVTIKDASVVTIAATDATASEIGPDPGMYRITRTGGDQSTSLTVNYVRDASSTASTSDYQTLLGFALIPANVGFVDVPLTPVLDEIGESTETVVLVPQATGNYWAGGDPVNATLNIIDAYGDSDGDALADAMEAVFGTSPLTYNPEWKNDADGDGLPDSYESVLSLNPNFAESAPGLPSYDKCPLP